MRVHADLADHHFEILGLMDGAHALSQCAYRIPSRPWHAPVPATTISQQYVHRLSSVDHPNPAVQAGTWLPAVESTGGPGGTSGIPADGVRLMRSSSRAGCACTERNSGRLRARFLPDASVAAAGAPSALQLRSPATSAGPPSVTVRLTGSAERRPAGRTRTPPWRVCRRARVTCG
jgi:hypothetical protein